MQNTYISSVLTDSHPEFTLSQRKEAKTRESARINGLRTVGRLAEAPNDVTVTEETMRPNYTLSPLFQSERPTWLVFMCCLREISKQQRQKRKKWNLF